MDWPFGDLRPLSYNVIVADPPWNFALFSEAGAEKSASAQYETMAFDDIVALPVGQLAGGDCLLLLWMCEWIPPGDRQKLLDAWGFTYKSSMVWRKVTKNGKGRMGTGYRVRTMHEPVIIATIGNPQHKAFPSVFDGVARQHSRKPESFFDLVLTRTHGARADLFSRESRDGFVGWGNQSTIFDAGDPVSLKRQMPQEQRVPEPLPLFEPGQLANLYEEVKCP